MKKKFYTKINNNFNSAFREKVINANSIVITSHLSPDDDSISSTLLIYFYLTKYLRIASGNIKLIITGEKSERWEHFNGFDKIKFVDDLGKHLEEVEVLIMLDGSGWKRFIKSDKPRGFKGYTICIDHHPNPANKFDLHLLAENYVSTAEIIYKLFLKEERIDKDLAEIIFLGVWGDTGGLRFVNSNETSAFETIKRVVEIGNINIQTLTSKYMKIDFRLFNIISKLMSNTKIMNIKGWPPFQVASIDKDFINKGKYHENEVTEGYHIYIDRYVRMLKGADWGFVSVPKKDGYCYFSFRSLPGSVNVRLLAEDFAGGGGHDRASGAKLEEQDVTKSLKSLYSWMSKNKPTLS